MSTGMVFYISIIIFLISLLGLLISSDAISSFIARQMMIAASVINFLSFSLRTAPQDPGIRTLLILGLATFYLLEFTIVFYIYSNTVSPLRKTVFKGYRLLCLEKSDWWGEDKI